MSDMSRAASMGRMSAPVIKMPQDNSLVTGFLDHSPSHYGEEMTFASILPPAFICAIISMIWSIHFGLHLHPLLQTRLPHDMQNPGDAQRGWRELVISQALVCLVLTCYARAVLTAPGSVPNDAVWRLGACGSGSIIELPTTQEVKVSGERRHCKWCLKYKPDRCHHCRVCKNCVLKMDHHCPWIMNCVGFGNHKYFFLLVVYTVTTCSFIAYTQHDSVMRSYKLEMPTSKRFLLVLGTVFATIMATLMLAFLAFHTYLMLGGMTTIEFCEKNTTRRPGMPMVARRGTNYDRGVFSNLQAVLGPRPLFWLLPICPPDGDGMSFPITCDMMPALLASESKRDGTCSGTRGGGAVEAETDPEWTGHRGSLVSGSIESKPTA